MNTARIFNVNSLNNTLTMSENSYFTSIVNDQNTMLYSPSNKDINPNNVWRSFTPAITGYLKSIYLYININGVSANATLTFNSG